MECLRLLYERLYSANADYGESLRRSQIIEIFEEALVRAPVLDLEPDISGIAILEIPSMPWRLFLTGVKFMTYWMRMTIQSELLPTLPMSLRN